MNEEERILIAQGKVNQCKTDVALWKETVDNREKMCSSWLASHEDKNDMYYAQKRLSEKRKELSDAEAKLKHLNSGGV